MIAPNWERGHVLTWSGKWHVINPAHFDAAKHEQRSYCGAYGYTEDTVPRSNLQLLAIRNGNQPAPVCKKCERAQANAADTADGAR